MVIFLLLQFIWIACAPDGNKGAQLSKDESAHYEFFHLIIREKEVGVSTCDSRSRHQLHSERMHLNLDANADPREYISDPLVVYGVNITSQFTGEVQISGRGEAAFQPFNVRQHSRMEDDGVLGSARGAHSQSSHCYVYRNP